MQRSAQTDSTNDDPSRFLELIHSDPTCAWCKHPEKSLYRATLCRHCYNISRNVASLKSTVQQRKARKQFISFDLDYRLKTAQRMVDLAKLEGAKYGNIPSKNVTGLDLEREFSLLSKALIKKDLFDGNAANLFDWSFSVTQKRLIYYLISKLMRERSRRARRGIGDG